MIIDKNKEINLISRKNTEDFTNRHIIDCVQIIDLIDLSKNMCTDIGSGAGLPGIILAILLKDKKTKTKICLQNGFHFKAFLEHNNTNLKMSSLGKIQRYFLWTKIFHVLHSFLCFHSKKEVSKFLNYHHLPSFQNNDLTNNLQLK